MRRALLGSTKPPFQKAVAQSRNPARAPTCWPRHIPPASVGPGGRAERRALGGLERQHALAEATVVLLGAAAPVLRSRELGAARPPGERRGWRDPIETPRRLRGHRPHRRREQLGHPSVPQSPGHQQRLPPGSAQLLRRRAPGRKAGEGQGSLLREPEQLLGGVHREGASSRAGQPGAGGAHQGLPGQESGQCEQLGSAAGELGGDLPSGERRRLRRRGELHESLAALSGEG